MNQIRTRFYDLFSNHDGDDDLESENDVRDDDDDQANANDVRDDGDAHRDDDDDDLASDVHLLENDVLLEDLGNGHHRGNETSLSYAFAFVLF